MIAKIAHISDLHLDERNRLDEAVSLFKTFTLEAEDAKVDLIAITGDIFERKSSPRERQALAELLIDAATVCPVEVLQGNHDAEGDLDLFELLETRHPVNVHSRATQIDPIGIHASMGPGRPMIGIMALPWFDKAHLVAQLLAERQREEREIREEEGEAFVHELSPQRTTERVIATAQRLLEAFDHQAKLIERAGAVPILLAHGVVVGSELSTGQTLQGTTVELAPSDYLASGAAAVLLGHIHKPQSWFEGRVGMAGSHRQVNWGEAEEKGWRLVEIESGKIRLIGAEDRPGYTVRESFRPLPIPRAITIHEDWTVEWTPEITKIHEHQRQDVAGARVRLQVKITPERLDFLDHAALRDLFVGKLGALELKIEPDVQHPERVRSAEIAKATTLWEKAKAYWKASGQEHAPDLMIRLDAKLGWLQAPEGAALIDPEIEATVGKDLTPQLPGLFPDALTTMEAATGEDPRRAIPADPEEEIAP